MDTQILNLENPLWMETLGKIRHDTYHLPEYVLADAKRTKTTPEAFLLVDGDKIFFLPYLLRKCDDILPTESSDRDIFDVISPYGYPGILLSEAAANTPGFPDFAIEELKRVLRNKNVCSAFFRLHPILNDNFKQIFQPEIFTDNGETVSVDLKLSAVEGGRRRVEAKTSYYFERTYFEDLSKLGDRIHLCIVEKEEQIASICLFLECGGIAQAHLGGSKTEFLSESPFSLVFDYGRYWAKERRNEFFHIGGGVGGSNQDHLYIFKSGFSKTKHKFLTLKLILDNDKYYDLVELKAKSLRTTPEEILKSKIFPAYRSS